MLALGIVLSVSVSSVSTSASMRGMTDLDDLGKKHKRLLRELDELKPALHEAMRKERTAGATQREIMERSGYKTIQQVRVITGEAQRP